MRVVAAKKRRVPAPDGPGARPNLVHLQGYMPKEKFAALKELFLKAKTEGRTQARGVGGWVASWALQAGRVAAEGRPFGSAIDPSLEPLLARAVQLLEKVHADEPQAMRIALTRLVAGLETHGMAYLLGTDVEPPKERRSR